MKKRVIGMSPESPHHEAETAQSVAIVQQFFDATVATPEGFWSSFSAYFNNGTVWENVGVATTSGAEEAANFAKAFPIRFHHMRIEDLVLSGVGNRVYAERQDHFCRQDGTIIVKVRVLGVLEIEGGKIARWRDYFDTAGFLAAVGQQAH